MRIAVAEPSVIIRSGILSVLKRLSNVNIQAVEISEMARLEIQLERQKPDILIINPSLLGYFSLEKIKEVSGCRQLKCIALIVSPTDASVLRTYDDSIQMYDTADQIREKLIRLNNTEQEENLPSETLSPREKEIVVGVVKGLTNKQIAEHLCLSAHTVITHRRNIANKLQIHSPAGLTIYAIVNKLVELNEIKETIMDTSE